METYYEEREGENIFTKLLKCKKSRQRIPTISEKDGVQLCVQVLCPTGQDTSFSRPCVPAWVYSLIILHIHHFLSSRNQSNIFFTPSKF